MRKAEVKLPPGAGRPEIVDDYGDGDVFDFQLALVGDGFDYGVLEAYAKALRKELSLVE